jgi:hypothetical protein
MFLLPLFFSRTAWFGIAEVGFRARSRRTFFLNTFVVTLIAATRDMFA